MNRLLNFFNIPTKNIDISGIIKKIYWLAFFIVIVFTAFSNALIIQENEIVIIKEFGRVVDIIQEPGLHFKIPFMQNTFTLSKSAMQYNSLPAKILTKDKKSIIIDNYTIWQISDAQQFIKTVQTVSGAELVIDNTVYSVTRSKLSTLSFEEINSGKAADGNFNQAITNKVNDQLQSYGLKIVDVKLRSCTLPPENVDSVYDKMKSEREKIASQHIIMGEKEATAIKAEADKQVKIIMSKAHADAETLKGQADAEAAKIYAESYNQDAEFYKFVRTLESYKKTLKNKPTIVIPVDSPYAKYLMGER